MLSLIHNNRDHKKIAIIDGQIAYTGGANIADEYINKKVRFGHWKDTGIKVVGDATKSFTLMFLETWHYFRNSSEDCSIYLNTLPLINNDFHKGYAQPYLGDPMVENSIARDVYLNIINNANNYIYLTTPYLAVDSEFLTSLTNASKRGVDIKIITPHIPDKKYIFRVTESYYQHLINHGIKVYEYAPGFIHSKMIIADDILATVGTINFDYRSFYHNYECGVWLYDTDSIKNIKEDFNNTIKNSIEVNNEFIKKNITWFKRLLGEIFKLFAPLF
jgi:cardiolipin synthase